MPGTKMIIQKILDNQMDNVASIVMDFEDAIKENDLSPAESNVLEHLDQIQDAIENGSLSIDNVPLIFIRVRNTDQFRSFAKNKSSPSFCSFGVCIPQIL